jgi:hypothetical protein
VSALFPACRRRGPFWPRNGTQTSCGLFEPSNLPRATGARSRPGAGLCAGWRLRAASPA